MDAARETHDDPDAGDAFLDRRRIGEILIELGLITPGKLEYALERQRQSGGRIGEILVEQGAMSRLDLASALAEYWEPQRYTPVIRRPISLAGAGPLELPVPPAHDREMLAELEERLAEAERRLEDEGAHRKRSLFRRDDDALTSGMHAVEDAGASLSALDSRIDAVEAVRRTDAVAVGVRLAALERTLGELVELRRAEALAVGERLAALERAVAELHDELPG